jgi:hypothetical protein
LNHIKRGPIDHFPKIGVILRKLTVSGVVIYKPQTCSEGILCLSRGIA